MVVQRTSGATKRMDYKRRFAPREGATVNEKRGIARKLIALGVIVISILTFSVKPSEARPKIQTINYAINLNWCGHVKRYCKAGRQALEVARCETGNTFDIWAGYGKHQYLGLWQMGNYERRRFGHGWNAWEQAKAAHKYYVVSGKDWSPWSCRWAAY